ncbi:MAG: hypothetical protein H6668_12225 [Ardenticatenaceae bacterium]|nr:hypothetical protein [Ardenticatenaceae bacterium]
MKYSNRWILVLFALAAMGLLAACGRVEAETAKVEPAKIEPTGDEGFNKVTLTEKAAQRLGIATETVGQMGQGTTVPYAALVYGLNGETWVYVSPSPLTYVRQTVTVDHIEDGMVVLADGPAVGAEVVTVAVAELYGADTGVGK